MVDGWTGWADGWFSVRSLGKEQICVPPPSSDQRYDVSQGFPKEELLTISLLVGVPWHCLSPFLPPALLQRAHGEASFLFYETPCSPFTSTL